MNTSTPRICERSTILGFPVRRVIEFGAIFAITKVVNGGVIAVDFHPCRLGDVGLPRPIVRRLQRQPPCQHNDEARKANCFSHAAAARHHDGYDHGEDIQRRQGEAKCVNGEIKIERCGCPDRENE